MFEEFKQEMMNELEVMQEQVHKLQSQVESLSNKPDTSTNFLQQAGIIEKKKINTIVSDSVHDILWDEISFTSSFATASITTTTTELLDANGRESDTSQGRRFQPNRESRFRTSFYLGAGISKSTVYITSPAVSSSASIGTSIVDAAKSFVGIKIVAGAVYLSSSVAGTVTNIATQITISTDATNVLEIDYFIDHATVLFNGQTIGDISCNLKTIACETFFPFLISIGSSDATSVNVTTESFEFLQKKR